MRRLLALHSTGAARNEVAGKGYCRSLGAFLPQLRLHPLENPWLMPISPPGRLPGQICPTDFCSFLLTRPALPPGRPLGWSWRKDLCSFLLTSPRRYRHPPLLLRRLRRSSIGQRGLRNEAPRSLVTEQGGTTGPLSSLTFRPKPPLWKALLLLPPWRTPPLLTASGRPSLTFHKTSLWSFPAPLLVCPIGAAWSPFSCPAG